MKTPRVLVTGPVESLAEYCDAARGAGWEAIEFPLLRIEPQAVDMKQVLSGRFDLVCITSSNALPFLESALKAARGIRSTPCAVVGEKCAARVKALGFRIDAQPAADAAELAEDVLRRTKRGARVLWPHGNLSDELARALREGGLEVVGPVVYATQTLDTLHEIPDAQAVFFASPSAVRAWSSRPGPRAPRAWTAIAIGPTTFDALQSETEAEFFDTISLPQTTSAAFAQVLAHLDVETPP